jgi:hypothetical protein
LPSFPMPSSDCYYLLLPSYGPSNCFLSLSPSVPSTPALDQDSSHQQQGSSVTRPRPPPPLGRRPQATVRPPGSGPDAALQQARSPVAPSQEGASGHIWRRGRCSQAARDSRRRQLRGDGCWRRRGGKRRPAGGRERTGSGVRRTRSMG